MTKVAKSKIGVGSFVNHRFDVGNLNPDGKGICKGRVIAETESGFTLSVNHPVYGKRIVQFAQPGNRPGFFEVASPETEGEKALHA